MVRFFATNHAAIRSHTAVSPTNSIVKTMPKKSFTDASSKTSGGHCHGSARPHSTHNHIYYKMNMYIFVMYWTIIIHTVHMQLNPTMFIFLFCADQMWSSSTNFFSPIIYIYIFTFPCECLEPFHGRNNYKQ